MRGGKYKNKSPRMRFFHKYTGLIVLSIVLTIIGIVWAYDNSLQVFFEGYDCTMIDLMDHRELFGKEHERFHEIYADCRNELFAPDFAP